MEGQFRNSNEFLPFSCKAFGIEKFSRGYAMSNYATDPCEHLNIGDGVKLY